MRYPEGQREATRRKILEAAGRVFRRRGYKGAGVDDVMAEAGLTAGAFYKHFDSKASLLEESLYAALDDNRERRQAGLEGLEGHRWIAGLADNYLSIEHWRSVDTGCPLPPLLAEVSRTERAARRSLQAGLERWSEEVARHIEPRRSLERSSIEDSSIERRERAMGVLATMIGGMVFARALDEQPARRVLRGARRTIYRALGLDWPELEGSEVEGS